MTDSFPPSDVPGVGTHADFLRSDAFVEVDYREPLYPKKGGWYRLDFSHYDDRTAGQFTFNRIDADLRQFFGFLAGRRVIATRLFCLDVGHRRRPDDAVLFHADARRKRHAARLPRVPVPRPHAILAQAEYRWEIWSGFDGALFYDAGKVADRRGDLNFKDLETDYGFGFRFNTNNGIIFRVDAGVREP